MTAVALITTCRRSGIRLHADGVCLDLDAPVGSITPELRASLATNKLELLAILWRLDGMRRHTEPVPCAKSPREAPGGPGRCFSCGDPHEHPQSYGRCAPCQLAAEAFYRERADLKAGDAKVGG